MDEDPSNNSGFADTSFFSINSKNKNTSASFSSFSSYCYSPDELNSMQRKLGMKLGPEHVSYRAGAGGTRIAYIEGWKVFNLANSVFGFNGWSHSILNISTDYIDVVDGRISVGVSVTVRVTLKDGSFHEDIGYGSSENQRSKAAALEKAKKEAVTDAVKRALRFFGNLLGNCTYDKSYLEDIKSVQRMEKSPLNSGDLYREDTLLMMLHEENNEIISTSTNSKRPTLFNTSASTPTTTSAVKKEEETSIKSNNASNSSNSNNSGILSLFRK